VGRKFREVLLWTAVAALLVYAADVAYRAETAPQQLLPQQAVTFAALAAIGGWIVTAYYARLNSIKQHTISVLAEMRTSQAMIQNVEKVLKIFPIGQPVPRDYVESKPWNDPVIMAAIYILNYLEFLAVGIHHGDLDHDLVKSYLRTLLCGYCVKFDSVINRAIQQDGRGANSTIYIHLRVLHNAWRHR
jgi:hypothetical protein